MLPLHISLPKLSSHIRNVYSAHHRMIYPGILSIILILFLNFIFIPSVLSENEFPPTISSLENNQNATPDNIYCFSPSSISSSSFTINESTFVFPGFTENQGQIDDADLYYYFMEDTYIIGFYDSKLQVFTRLNQKDPWEHITISFPGAIISEPRGFTQLITTTNYFTCIPAIIGVRHWAEIWYNSLYPGISLRFFADGQAIKYEFLVDPEIDPGVIQLDIEQSNGFDMSFTPNRIHCTSITTSNLILWEDLSPMAFQTGNPAIKVEFRSISFIDGRYGFTVGPYDHSMTLVIDPVILIWSSFLGGLNPDFGEDIAVDDNGCTYITGCTDSLNFPKINAYDAMTSIYTVADVFVTKLAADGRSLIYSTYIGGLDYDAAYGIFVDAMGCAYITGCTWYEGFPTVNAYDSSSNGMKDIFVTKLAADGQSLIYSTYLGGSGYEEAHDITVDEEGCAYIAGFTDSSNIPTGSAFDTASNGFEDIFIAKFATDGQSLIYSTYLGGSISDIGESVAVDALGCAYVTGYTTSTDFPTKNAYNIGYNGNCDIYVTKLAPDGQSLVYSTYLGGSYIDIGESITVDITGCVYITGRTESSNFPMVNSYDATYNIGGYDAIILKLAPDGQSLIFSTYLGGSVDDRGYGIAVDFMGYVYITGTTQSSDFPTINAYDATYNEGGGDTFVLKLDLNGQSLIYSTYLGGSGEDYVCGIAIDFMGCVYITGYLRSSDFSTLYASYDPTFNGDWDIFMCKFDLDSDLDTISDGWEQQMGLNAADPTDAPLDKDNDGMPNLWEYQMWFNAADPSDAALDKDNDGLTNLLEYLLGTDTRNPDTDGDFIPDGWEYIMSLNPKNSNDNGMDKDLDGMPNLWEFQMGLNATDPTDAALDKDDNGLPNLWEFQMGLNATDPTDAALDADTDGLINLMEYQLGTSARNPDTDGDFMLDGWEYSMTLNATDPTDATLDKDGDGLPNLWEFQMELNATFPIDIAFDNDDDGLTNLMEYQLGTDATDPDSDDDLMGDSWEFLMGLDATDPTDAALDKDKDGLPNLWEFLMGLNAANPFDATFDMDEDGMPNLWEYQMRLDVTDPTDAALDMDGDGMPNLWEYQMELDATDPTDAALDKDKDGLPNLWEYQMELDATDPTDAALDMDGDGLSNSNEYKRGTSPWDADTDHDGWRDKWDISPHGGESPGMMIINSTFVVGVLIYFSIRGVRSLKKIRKS